MIPIYPPFAMMLDFIKDMGGVERRRKSFLFRFFHQKQLGTNTLTNIVKDIYVIK